MNVRSALISYNAVVVNSRIKLDQNVPVIMNASINATTKMINTAKSLYLIAQSVIMPGSNISRKNLLKAEALHK